MSNAIDSTGPNVIEVVEGDVNALLSAGIPDERLTQSAVELQATLAFLIPNYVDDPEALARLMDVKETVDRFIELHSPLPQADNELELQRTVHKFSQDIQDEQATEPGGLLDELRRSRDSSARTAVRNPSALDLSMDVSMDASMDAMASPLTTENGHAEDRPLSLGIDKELSELLQEIQMPKGKPKRSRSISSIFALAEMTAEADLALQGPSLLSASQHSGIKLVNRRKQRQERMEKKEKQEAKIGSKDVAADAARPVEMETCSICFEERILDMLPCGSVFCAECIQTHLYTNIMDGRALQLRCPAMTCDYAMTEEDVRRYLTDRQFKRYRQFIITAQVRNDPDRKCCPTADCTGILRRIGEEGERDGWMPEPYTRCKECESELCFTCLRSYHPETSCSQFESELRLKNLLSEEDDIRKWQLENNAKECPKCHSLIVKNEGCNHIRCTTCGENFCWLCGQRNATEGHFNKPGKCFGRLFEEDASTDQENLAGVLASVVLFPITGPLFGLASVMEGMKRQKGKMSRRLHGVDFTIAAVGAATSGKKAWCQTISRGDRIKHLEKYEEFGIIAYSRQMTVNLVRCRLTILEVNGPMDSDEAKRLLADVQGFIVFYAERLHDTFDQAVVHKLDLDKVTEKAGVPGILMAVKLDKKGRKVFKDQAMISKVQGQERAQQLNVAFRRMQPSSTWSAHMGLRALLKAMLERWEPVVDPIIQDAAPQT